MLEIISLSEAKRVYVVIIYIYIEYSFFYFANKKSLLAPYFVGIDRVFVVVFSFPFKGKAILIKNLLN